MHCIVRDVFVETRIDGIGGNCRHQDRVAVRRGLRDRLGPDIAAGTGLVFHDELPAQYGFQRERFVKQLRRAGSRERDGASVKMGANFGQVL